MDLREEDIPKLQYFNKCVLAGIVSYDVVFIFACTLLITGKTNPESYSLSSVQNVQLISGIAADKKCLIVPWLVIKLMSWLFSLVFVISIMFAVANVQEILLYVLFPCGKLFLILKSKELLFNISSHSQVFLWHWEPTFGSPSSRCITRCARLSWPRLPPPGGPRLELLVEDRLSRCPRPRTPTRPT